MKKQFFRAKQLANQTFSRAGKTEALSDDLQAADKRVEFIRSACQNTAKKLTSSIQGQDANAKEKRLKKNAEYLLGIAMLESGTSEEDCLLRHIISECGKLEMCLANACVDYEAKVEVNVLAILQQVCDVDIPNIMKIKNKLAKLILDMDSARTRYQNSLKHTSSSQGNKVESIKDELEEAETKVEQCRDLLSCEMFQLISKEAELAATVLEYARLQRSYHQTALSTLDEMIPELESNILDCSDKPVFGVPLEEHLRVTNRKVAFPIELCVCALSVLAMDEEGLFRVTGGSSKIKRMKLSLDANCMDLDTALEYRDPHVIASVLKSYLRQLPEPLMTHKLHDKWIAAAKVSGSSDERLQALWAVVQELPPANRENLRYLIKFLSLLSLNQENNKMTPQNIAIVMAPNLLWSPTDDGTNIGINMSTASLHSTILESLVSYSDWFFPGELDIFLTLTSPPQGSPKPMTRNRKSKPAPVPPSNPPVRNSQERRSFRKSVDVCQGVKEGEECDVAAAVAETQKLLNAELLHSIAQRTENIKIGEETTRKGDKTDSESVAELEPKQEEIVVDVAHRKPASENKHTEPTKPPPKPESRGPTDQLYATLERKRLPRPTPVPRTTLPDASAEKPKPAIPERPATLQRPLSSSFRVSRSIEPADTEKTGADGPVSLERAHVYSVAKQQQVAIIQVGGGEKPERPPKPETLTHKRTASEGNIVDKTSSRHPKSPVSTSRPQRPIPPPPPPPTSKKKDSTDL